MDRPRFQHGVSGGLCAAGDSNSLLDISRDGRLLACSNRDSGTVTLVDLADHTKRAEIPVGKHPEGVSFIGDSHRLAVAIHAADKIAFINEGRIVASGSSDDLSDTYGVANLEDAYLELVGRKELSRSHVAISLDEEVSEEAAGAAG